MIVSVTVHSRAHKKRKEPHRPKFGSFPTRHPDRSGVADIPMIRPFTIFCKLNQIHFSDRQWFEQEASSLSHTDGDCPVCHAHACMSPFASYTRYLVEWCGGEPCAHEMAVQRYLCSSCGHTHALLPSALVPYSSYSLRFILTVLRAYFLGWKSVQQICSNAGIAASTLYRWKALFLKHKAMWLGVLEELAISQSLFLESMDGTLLRGFYQTFLLSFMQNLRGGAAYLPQWSRAGPPAPHKTGMENHASIC